jgi:hypothetical protein
VEEPEMGIRVGEEEEDVGEEVEDVGEGEEEDEFVETHYLPAELISKLL